MRSQHLLSSPEQSGDNSSSPSDRKPGVRPRLSPACGSLSASARNSPTPPHPARLSPVGLLIGGGGGGDNNDGAGGHGSIVSTYPGGSACTPPPGEIVVVPSSAVLTRALLRKPKASAAVRVTSAHNHNQQQQPQQRALSPLPPMAPLPPPRQTSEGSTAPATATATATATAGEGVEQEEGVSATSLAREKRSRQLVSAGSVSSVSSAAAPLIKRHAYDEKETHEAEGSGDVNNDAKINGKVALLQPDKHASGAQHGSATETYAATAIAATDASHHRYVDDNDADDCYDVDHDGFDEEEDAAAMASLCGGNYVLTAELLRDWVGYEDLDLVLSAEFQIDAERVIGLDELGRRLLPRLAALRLSRSLLPRVRLLGTRYAALRHLWVNSCGLEDLRGIGACAPALTELYASFNSIRDVAPLLDLCGTLEVLDVEGNLIDDVAGLGYVLPSMRRVTSLSLSGNGAVFKRAEIEVAVAALSADMGTGTGTTTTTPTTVSGGGGSGVGPALRRWVRLLMPQLELLDDAPLPCDDDGPSSTDRKETCNGNGSAGEGDGAHTSQTHQVIHCDKDDIDDAYSGGHRCRRPGTAHVDPLDDALSAELLLLQRCIRENDSFCDSLTDNLEVRNSAHYARPSTSCAAGARQRLGSSASRPGSSYGRCPTANAVTAAAAAATAASRGSSGVLLSSRLDKRPGSSGSSSSSRNNHHHQQQRLPSAGPVAAVSSDLTTGTALAGSAIASLRRRLQSQSQPRPSPGPRPAAGAAAVAASFTSTTSTTSNSDSSRMRQVSSPMFTPEPTALGCHGEMTPVSRGDGIDSKTNNNYAASPTLFPASSPSADAVTTTTTAAAEDNIAIGAGNEEESAYDDFKAALSRQRALGGRPSTGSLVSVSLLGSSSSGTADAAFEGTRYRQLYRRFFPAEDEEEQEQQQQQGRGAVDGSRRPNTSSSTSSISVGNLYTVGKNGGIRGGASGGVAPSPEAAAAAETDALVKTEMFRARAQLAAMAAAAAAGDSDDSSEEFDESAATASGGGGSVWAKQFAPRPTTVAADGAALSAATRVLLHQPDVLQLELNERENAE